MTVLKPICEIFSLRMGRGLSLSGESTLHLSNSYYKDKYRIFRNVKGNSIGYIIWAEVSEESYFRVFNYGYFPKYQYEWDEGNICLILDVVFAQNHACEAKRRFLSFVKSFDFVAFKRRSSPRLYTNRKKKFVDIAELGLDIA